MKLSVLMPAYQEERTIGLAAQRVASIATERIDAELELIVCDDGSTDGTADEVRRLQAKHKNIKLISLPFNCGKGSAIRAALEHAQGDYVLIQDADLEYDVEAYPAMLAAARNGASVVYGSRFKEQRFPSGMHGANYVANKALTLLANVLFSCKITDEATCLKLFRTDLLRSLELTCTRFEFCPEVTAKLGLLRVPIAEVSVSYRGRDVRSGKKVRWTDGVEAALVLLSYRVKPLRDDISRLVSKAATPDTSATMRVRAQLRVDN